MNGRKAKKMRRLAKYSIKSSRNLTPDKLYYTKEHIKIINKIKFISLQVFCKGERALYKLYKKGAKHVQ